MCNKRVRIIDYIYIYSIRGRLKFGVREWLCRFVYRFISEHRIVLCNTGRMTEAVLFSAKQAVTRKRTLPPRIFVCIFFFSLFESRDLSSRDYAFYVDDASRRNLEFFSNKMDRIFKQFVKKTHLRNYYHEDEGLRGVDVARIARAFLIQGARSYWLTTRRKGDVENAKRKTEKQWDKYTCIRVHPVAYRDWSEASPENACTFCPSISSKRIQQVKSVHISFSFFFLIRFLLGEFFFFFIQSSLNECRAILINHVSLYLHDLLLFVIIYLYNKSLLYSFIRMIKNGPTFAFLITINIFQLITALAENC